MRYTERTIPFLALIIATILFGTTYPIVKIGLSVLDPPIPPLGYLFMRFSLALIVIIPLLPKFATMEEIKYLLKNRYILLLGIVNGVSYILQFSGQVGTTAGMATLMVNTYLISTPLLTSLYLNSPVGKNLKIAIVMASLGILVVTSSVLSTDVQITETWTFLAGTFTVLISGLLWGSYALISNQFYTANHAGTLGQGKNHHLFHPITIFILSNFYSVILIIPSMIFTGDIPQIAHFSKDAIIVIIYLAIACTDIAFILYIFANRVISPSISNIVLLLNVIIGLILSSLILGDTLSPLLFLGSFFILLAIFLATKSETATSSSF
ncbi:MAG: DMT family transporter [Candidatus Hodarchaeales archaeon]